MYIATAMRTVIIAMVIGCMIVVTGFSRPSFAASADQAPPVDPSQARVWFLRALDPGRAMHAPMIYANGAPLAISSEGTVFYRDFAPGDYAFNVDNCNPGNGRALTIPLAPGNEFALQVQSDDLNMSECSTSYYLTIPSADMLSTLFAPLAYLGQR